LARPIRCRRRETPFGAPVDAEVERGGRDNGPESTPRHRRFDLAALLDGEAAVVQSDGEAMLVQAPELLKHQLGLCAGVDKDQRGPGIADALVNLGHGMDRHMARPGQVLTRGQDIDLRLRAGPAFD
jgi:hypothetical protein